MLRSKLKVLTDADFLAVENPGRYIGGELNSITKNDSEVSLHFALAFPDSYEIGMSHIGLQLLYDIINKRTDTWAERVYMPLPDMEQLLRKKSAPLTSLEAKRPLSEFDILGFSLQYELCGTNILAMLELGGIPLLAKDRMDFHPLIIAGGPYAYHAEALAPFFDLFFLGDAEEAVHEIIEVVKQNKNTSREKLLIELSQIEGIYCPSHYQPVYREDNTFLEIRPIGKAKPKITRRLLPSMEGAPYPQAPLVPNVKTIHNRLRLEVMRGCVRGCRFCQAGYVYRPQRERSPEEIVEMAKTALQNSGFEEMSLLSLSTADYCSIVPLLKQLNSQYNQDNLAISFPSTRVDALTPEILENVQESQRKGFTMAPEAGTQRLRDVINKGVTDQEILETCQNVFRMGWDSIKLYFMMGLPTETDEDLMGIVDIARRVKTLPESRGKQITVSVSTHVPKPHTPFQWAQQITPTEATRRQYLLADALRKVGVTFRYHQAFSIFLEGVFCRGDRDLHRVILRAYELGCRLDGTTEYLKQDLWTQAFIDCNIDPNYFLRERSVEENLPWDHLSCGIPKDYFAKEYKRALRFKETPDCLTASCSICGACNYQTSKNILWPRQETEAVFSKSFPVMHSTQNSPNCRIRLSYQKFGPYKFIGHLDLSTAYYRAVRRAALPIAYSKGFSEMPKLSFGPPLPVGVESDSEYLDLFLLEKMDPEMVKDFLNQTLPAGILVTQSWEVDLKTPSIQESIFENIYKITWLSEINSSLEKMLSLPAEDLLASLGSYIVSPQTNPRLKPNQQSKQRTKIFDLSSFISAAYTSPDQPYPSLTISLKTQAGIATPKIADVIFSISTLEPADYIIHKIASKLKEPKEKSQISSQRLSIWSKTTTMQI